MKVTPLVHHHSDPPFSSSSSGSLPSSSSTSPPYGLYRLSELYFCDECDAIRCNDCVNIDIAAYYCPGCLFEVPGASVKSEKMRCARSCFACPECDNVLTVSSSDLSGEAQEDGNDIAMTTIPEEPKLTRPTVKPRNPALTSMGGPPYILTCTACRWSSRSIGWEFSKQTGIGHQVMEREKVAREDLNEFDQLVHLFEGHLSRVEAATAAAAKTSTKHKSGINALAGISGRNHQGSKGSYKSRTANTNQTFSESSTTMIPSRHISAASSAVLNRASYAYNTAMSSHRKASDPSSSSYVSSSDARTRKSAALRPKKIRLQPEIPDQDLKIYQTKRNVKNVVAGLEGHHGFGYSQVQKLREFDGKESGGGLAALDKVWEESWSTARTPESLQPQRLPLRAKLTKRCCECNHTLIRPESKAQSVRYKIKIIASDYIPSLELGNRRKIKGIDGVFPRHGQRHGEPGTEELEKSLSRINTLLSVRDMEEKERMDKPLSSGSTYSFQLALVNPLLDSIEVNLKPIDTLPDEVRIIIPERAFSIGAFAEPWEMEAEEQSANTGEGAGKGDPKSTSGSGSIRTAARGRSSLIGRPNRIGGVEKKGNITKVGFLALVGDQAVGQILFDLEVTFTYRAEEEVESIGNNTTSADNQRQVIEVSKSFTYNVRVHLGHVLK